MPDYIQPFLTELAELLARISEAIATSLSSKSGQQSVLVLIAPGLQVLGYVTYILFTFGGQTRPNPWSWLMFAYGTSFLTLIEYKLGAPMHLLFLPVVCAVMSIFVYVISLIASLTRPHESFHILDPIALAVDVGLTWWYIQSANSLMAGGISAAEHNGHMTTFLILTNLTILTAFTPQIRTAGSEAPIPWIIWTAAYSSLAYLTFLEQGRWDTVLMLYPAISAVMHLAVAVLSLGRSSRG